MNILLDVPENLVAKFMELHARLDIARPPAPGALPLTAAQQLEAIRIYETQGKAASTAYRKECYKATASRQQLPSRRALMVKALELGFATAEKEAIESVTRVEAQAAEPVQFEAPVYPVFQRPLVNGDGKPLKDAEAQRLETNRRAMRSRKREK